jgi:hypothetical protein
VKEVSADRLARPPVGDRIPTWVMEPPSLGAAHGLFASVPVFAPSSHPAIDGAEELLRGDR